MMVMCVRPALAKRSFVSAGILVASAITAVAQVGPVNPNYQFERPPQDTAIPYTRASCSRVEIAKDGPKDRRAYPPANPRIVIDNRASQYHERVALVAFRFGDALPSFTEAETSMELTRPDEQSSVRFSEGPDPGTVVSLVDKTAAGR